MSKRTELRLAMAASSLALLLAVAPALAQPPENPGRGQGAPQGQEQRQMAPGQQGRGMERGKPLPPGIAKRFDDRTLRDLPRYDGYEWRRVGPDAVLVDIANDVIYEVLRDVLN